MNREDRKTIKVHFGCFFLLTVILLFLNVVGLTSLPWLVVFSPAILGVVLTGLVTLMLFALALLMMLTRK